MRIHFDVTAHGFGHLAMTSAVVRALLEQHPDHQISLGIDYSKEVLLEFLNPHELSKITIIKGPFDPAIPMDGPLQVDIPKTKSIYQEAIEHAPSILTAERERLRPISPDILVSNVSPWSLAAVADWQVKRIAFSSLDWANQLKFMGLEAEASFVRTLYQHADMFVGATPHADLDDMPNAITIGPMGRLGQNKRDILDQELGMPHLALLTFGGLDGISPQYSVALDGSLENWGFVTPDMAKQLGLSHVDCVASVDVLITKPGYGTYVEALLHQKPCLTWPRESWLEATNTNAFMQAHDALVIRDEAQSLKDQLERTEALNVQSINNSGAIELLRHFNL